MKTLTTKIRLAVLLAICLMGIPASAQVLLPQISWAVGGNLTAQTASICSSTTCVIMPVNAISNGVAWQITGTFSGTVTFEASLDGTNWIAAAVIPVGTTRTLVSTATAAGTWTQNVTGLAQVRARCSTYTSGTIAVAAKRSMGTPPSQ